MINKKLLFLSACVVLGLFAFYCLCLHTTKDKLHGVGINVDGSRLRIFNQEFIVTNALCLCVRPTKKTSEWIYIYDADSEIMVNEHRLILNQTSVEHICDDVNEDVCTAIESELPILLRFFKNTVLVAGSRTWTKGQIKFKNTANLYDVKIQTKKSCRVVIKGNWYEF